MNYFNMPAKPLGSLKKTFLWYAVFIACCSTAAAQNYTVTSSADTHAAVPASSPLDGGGQITLRSAVEAATAIAGTHIITIPASITVINLSLGQIPLGSAGAGNNITINGPGKSILTVNQTTAARVFFTGTGAITFSLNDLTLNYTGSSGTVGGGGGAIACGGVNAVTSMNNVAITNFNLQTGNGGAILCSTANANALTLTNCDFSNNKCGGGGGAVSYVGNSTCVITNCTFTNNLTGVVGANTGGGGGALTTSGSGNGGVYTVTNCSFVNNFAVTQGGAVLNTNGALTISFCRFVNNTATVATNGNTIAQAGGASVQTVNSNNNWWGANAPTANDNVVLAAGGSITCTKWLQLKLSASASSICTGTATTVTASFLSNSASEAVTTGNISRLIGLPVSFTSPVLGALSGAQATIQANGTATVTYTAGGTSGAGSANGVVDNVPNNDATAKASVTVLPTPSITASPSASTSCAGLAVSFSATAANNTAVVWQESTTIGFAAPTTLSNTGIYSGATSTTLTISDNTSVTGRYYRLLASNSNGCASAASTPALLTATSPSLSANNTVTQNTGTANNIYYAASCAAICKVVPSGASPVSGSVTSQVWVEGSVPTYGGQPFVQRHYQVTPATNAATATGTVTLYFSQAEFSSFNADPASGLDLPTGPADATGKANLRIGKYSGSSNNGSGLPASYTSSVTVLDPPDANIVWNVSFLRWEVTVDVTGFSGFIIQTAVTVLPVQLTSFAAQLNNNAALVTWEIASGEAGIQYELQRSVTGTVFTTVNTQTGDATSRQFGFTDAGLSAANYYYRLKITNQSGKVSYSNVVLLKLGSGAADISFYPNPVPQGQAISVRLGSSTAQKIELTTIAGEVVGSSNKKTTGSYIINLPHNIHPGTYFIRAYTNTGVTNQKIVVQ